MVAVFVVQFPGLSSQVRCPSWEDHAKDNTKFKWNTHKLRPYCISLPPPPGCQSGCAHLVSLLCERMFPCSHPAEFALPPYYLIFYDIFTPLLLSYFFFTFLFFHLGFLRTLFLRYQGCPLRTFLVADVELRLLCGLLLRCPPLRSSRAGSLSSVSPAFVGGVLQALLHTGILWECVIGFCLFWIVEGCLSGAWGILSLFPITENGSEHLSGCRCLCGALATRYLLLGCWMMELLPRLIIISRSEGLHSHMRLGCSAYLMKFG